MATIIWCDKIKHVVKEPREEVERLIAGAQVADPIQRPQGFFFVTPESSTYDEPARRRIAAVQQEDPGYEPQRALNARLISSFEADPGDPI